MRPHRLTTRSLGMRRDGAVLICVLVCLAVASSIIMTSVQASLRNRRQLRRELQREQVCWLLEAGLARGVQNFRSKAGYRGETWHVGSALATGSDATIEIAMSPTDGSSNTRIVVSVRLVPTGEINEIATIKRTKSWLITTGSRDSGP